MHRFRPLTPFLGAFRPLARTVPAFHCSEAFALGSHFACFPRLASGPAAFVRGRATFPKLSCRIQTHRFFAPDSAFLDHLGMCEETSNHFSSGASFRHLPSVIKRTREPCTGCSWPSTKPERHQPRPPDCWTQHHGGPTQRVNEKPHLWISATKQGAETLHNKFIHWAVQTKVRHDPRAEFTSTQ